MKHPYPIVLVSLAVLTAAAGTLGQAAPPAGKSEAKSAPTAQAGLGAVRTPKLVQRVGGDRDLAIEVVDGVYRFRQAKIESPLPDGYPEPTPPGAIDVKEYPSVRRAELTSKDDANGGMTAGFFPLFNHIKKRDIAMTSPVEMDFPNLYTDFMNDEPTEEGESTMSFLYRSPTLGPVGKDGDIVIRDTAAATFLSIGVKGGVDATKELDSLRTWLKAQDQWEVAGDPRILVYNGPFIDPDWRWSEVQVPVRRRAAAAQPATGQTKPQAANPEPAKQSPPQNK